LKQGEKKLLILDVIDSLKQTRALHTGENYIREVGAMETTVSRLLFVYSSPTTTNRPANHIISILLDECFRVLDASDYVGGQMVLRGVVKLALVHGASDDVVRRMFELAHEYIECYPELHFLLPRATPAEKLAYDNFATARLLSLRQEFSAY